MVGHSGTTKRASTWRTEPLEDYLMRGQSVTLDDGRKVVLLDYGPDLGTWWAKEDSARNAVVIRKERDKRTHLEVWRER